MRKEWIARLVVGLLVGLAVSIPAAGAWRGAQATVIHARISETGGWTPGSLTVAAGQPLHLRLTSDDVTHGFAVGQSGQPGVDVLPGKSTHLSLTFDKPGTYTFYCSVHPNMTGTLTVK